MLKVLYKKTRIRARGSVLLDKTGGSLNYDFYPLRADPEDRGPFTEARMCKYEMHAGSLALRVASNALRNPWCIRARSLT